MVPQNRLGRGIQVRIVGMSRKPQKYRLFAQRLPEKAAENSQKTRIREKAGFGVVEPPRRFLNRSIL